MNQRNIGIFWTFLITLLISGCASENQDLVNPPPKSLTVMVRFLNLAGDKQPRDIVLEGTQKFAGIPYAGASEAQHPVTDSVTVEVINPNTGESEYKSLRRSMFARNLTYTFAALPRPFSAGETRGVDTVIAFSSSNTIPQYSIEGYVKLLNAYPDSSVSFTLRLGCPNGGSIISNIPFGRISSMTGTRSGKFTVSLIKIQNGAETPIALYEINLQARSQSVFIVFEGSDGNLEFAQLDETAQSANPIIYPQKVNERITKIRTVNFSSEAVDIVKTPGAQISMGLIPLRADKYQSIEACKSEFKDTLEVYSGNILRSKIYSAFEVSENYSLFVFDSADAVARKSILAAPVRLEQARAGRAVVRVIHADFVREGVTVSIGARSSTDLEGLDTVTGFKSGDVLAADLSYGYLSKYTLVEPGTLPIAVFTATQPAKYLYGSRITVEADKNYILVIYRDFDGNEKMSLIEDNEEEKQINFADYGAFVQVINGLPGQDYVNVTMPELFADAKVFFRNSLATIVSEGTNTITVNGIAHTFTAEKEKRIMIIASGVPESPEILNISSNPMNAGEAEYKRRYVNACMEIQNIRVKLNDSTVAADNIPYGSFTQAETINRDRKFSLFFDNANTDKNVAKFYDLFLSFAKNYSIIFVGNSSKGGYSIIIQQEY